jgi:hypothetical protein
MWPACAMAIVHIWPLVTLKKNLDNSDVLLSNSNENPTGAVMRCRVGEIAQQTPRYGAGAGWATQ